MTAAARPAVRLALVAHGAGNLASVAKALAAVGAEVRLTSAPDDARDCDAVVIPGVGHFAAARAIGDVWRAPLQRARAAGVPLLGICLGMQWLFDGSDEAPDLAGLGVFPGRCVRLTGDVKVPHVGWNTLDDLDRASPLLSGVEPGAMAYFTHAFAVSASPASIAKTTHGVRFAAAVGGDRVFGVQFHPEKSGRTGLAVLANFVSVVREAHAPCWPGA